MIKLATRVGRVRPQLKLNRSQIEDFVSNAKQLQRSNVKYEFALLDRPGAVVSLPGGKFAVVTERNGIPHITPISSSAVSTIKAQRKAMADMANRSRAEALREKEKTTPQPDPNDPKPVPEPQLLEVQRKLWHPSTWVKPTRRINASVVDQYAKNMKPGETVSVTTNSGVVVDITKTPKGDVYLSHRGSGKVERVWDASVGALSATGALSLMSALDGNDNTTVASTTTSQPAPQPADPAPAPQPAQPAGSGTTTQPTGSGTTTQPPGPKPASGAGKGGNNPTAGSSDDKKLATTGLWDQINNSDIVKWMKANPGTTLGVGLGVPAALLAIDSLLDDDDEEEDTRKMRNRMRRLGY